MACINEEWRITPEAEEVRRGYEAEKADEGDVSGEADDTIEINDSDKTEETEQAGEAAGQVRSVVTQSDLVEPLPGGCRDAAFVA